MGRKRSEEELQRSEAQLAQARRELQLTIDTIPAMVATFRPDGERDFVNKTWRDYFGLTSQEGEGQSYVVHLHPDDAGAVANAWRVSLESGQPFQMEMRVRGKDGSYRWNTVRRVPRRNKNGDIVKWYGVMIDIEEQRGSQNALRRSEALLAKAQRLSLTGSFSFNSATEEATWSDEVYRIHDYPPGTRVTLSMIDARYHPEDRHIFKEQVTRIRSGATDLDYEHRIVMPDGSIKYVHMVAHGSRGEDGGPMEYIGAIQDVTQRRLAEEGLHAAQAALAHANRVAALGEISATIAHEINQPLATIRTNGETGLRWLDRAEPNVAKVRDLIVRMLADAQRASEIIDRIRAMAAPRAPERKVLSLDDVIKESMVFLHHEFRSKSVAVSLDLASALPCVAADGTQLQQVVVNLAINAVQAMMEAETRPRRISIRTGFSEDNMVSCTVEDSGPGIDPAHLPRLFDGFFTTRDRGMGLGLAISRSIIEAHEGRIRADNESTLGGARFSFALPANGRPPVDRKPTNP